MIVSRQARLGIVMLAEEVIDNIVRIARHKHLIDHVLLGRRRLATYLMVLRMSAYGRQ